MHFNRTALLALASVGGALVIAAFGTGVMVFAQQTSPTPLSPPGTAVPAPVKKSPVAVAKPQPKPRAADGQAQPGNAAAAQTQQAAQQPTVFDEHARQGNIATCANVFGALGRGLATNSAFTAQSQWDAKAGNAHSVQSLVVLNQTQANGAQHAAGVVFAAPVGSVCEGNLVRVTPNPESCPVVAAELAKLNGQSGALGDLSLMTLPNGAQIMLIPFGNACVAVTALRIAGQ
ncbi:MAG: hypothetical protein AB1586_05075 [Pseudomonadota bacterium]